MARARLRYRPPTRQVASAGAIAHEGDSEEHCFKHLLEPIRDLAMGWCRTCCGMSPVELSMTVCRGHAAMRYHIELKGHNGPREVEIDAYEYGNETSKLTPTWVTSGTKK